MFNLSSVLTKYSFLLGGQAINASAQKAIDKLYISDI